MFRMPRINKVVATVWYDREHTVELKVSGTSVGDVETTLTRVEE